jgi:nucleotide-binding universal stress UspA family protein
LTKIKAASVQLNHEFEQLSQGMSFDMTFAAIMVSVEFEPDCKSRISLAAGLARRFNSLLIGVAGWPLLKAGLHSVPTSEIPTLESVKWVSSELDKLGQKFRAVAENITDQVEWRSSMDFPREVIPKEARAADLVVIGQDFLPGDVLHTYDPGTIILATGRPVLVVPQQIDHLEASRILIAWKDTREARRAVRDALPFLKQAKKVGIAVAKTPGAEDTDAQIADVIQYLGRHQLTDVQQISTVADGDEEVLLLDLAKQHNVNLIIAGAYGRTRLSEWIFGGVTRHLLVNSPIPCLFSN